MTTNIISKKLSLETTKGPILIEFFSSLAPRHVKQIQELVMEGAYDDVIFHRVIDGFMAQTGDVAYGKESLPDFNVNRAGTGGSEKPNLKAEFSNKSHKRGIVSMARSQNPDSANSQFFICFEDAPWLDGQYSIWGQVVEGMENVDKLERGEPPSTYDKIIKASLI